MGHQTAFHQLKAIKVAYSTLTKRYLGHIPVLQRLDRALDILVRDSQYAYRLHSTAPGMVIVKKEGTQLSRYEVDWELKRCTCPDSQEGNNICKHRLAHELLCVAQEVLSNNKEMVP